jgi:CRISPR-associated endonuclease Csn1
MRLHKGDTVEIDDNDGLRRVKIVHQIEISSNRVRLAPSQEGGKLQERHAAVEDLFRWDLAGLSRLKERNCLAVKVGSSGQIKTRARNI